MPTRRNDDKSARPDPRPGSSYPQAGTGRERQEAQVEESERIKLVSSLPSLPHPDFPEESVVLNQADGHVYRNILGTWTATSKDTDNVDGVDASQVISDINTALADASDAQATADGKIQSFYQSTAPSNTDPPLSEGDIWFDTSDGNRAYRYDASNDVWVDAQDDEITQAINDAADAQATADGKVQTFYQASEPSNTTPPLAVGDLWIDTDDGNRLHRYDGSSWVDFLGELSTLDVIGNTEIKDDSIKTPKLSVNDLSAITATLGTVTSGWIGDDDPSGSPSAAIRMTGTTPLPSTNFIDFTAGGSDPFLKHPALTLEAGGNATFSGTVAADHFSAPQITQGDTSAEAWRLRTEGSAPDGSDIPRLDTWDNGTHQGSLIGWKDGLYVVSSPDFLGMSVGADAGETGIYEGDPNDAANRLFYVESGAPSDSLYVDASGAVVTGGNLNVGNDLTVSGAFDPAKFSVPAGFGTSSPSYDIDLQAYQATLRLLDTNTSSSARIQNVGGDLRFISGGSTVGVFTNGERLGVGTATPSSKVDVYGSSPKVEITDSGTGYAGIIARNDNATHRIETSGSGLMLKNDTNGSTLLLKENNDARFYGKLGIGTASPSRPLHVEGSITTGLDDGFEMQTNSVLKAYGSRMYFDLEDTASAFWFRDSSNNVLARIEDNGRLGIGESNLQDALAVSSSVGDIAITNTNNNRNGGFIWRNSSDSEGIRAKILSTSEGTYGQKGISFHTGVASDYTTADVTEEQMRLDEYGRLLIGLKSSQVNADLQVGPLSSNGWTGYNSTTAIVEDNAGAKSESTSHYGYWAVANRNGRAAYFGRGNGGTRVDIAGDNASRLDFTNFDRVVLNQKLLANSSSSSGAGMSEHALRPIVHHGSNSPSAIGVEGAIHTQDQ